jgi:hypothetical protein
MPPIAFLALLTIVLLVVAALRLELNFRRASEERPGREAPRPRPELRTAPAGGYCQSPFPAPAFGKS